MTMRVVVIVSERKEGIEEQDQRIITLEVEN